ncbi:uncharacterized protein BXZ73DRAFT_106316 [Epithele typhae]|uniref:uncharacterized protein n=1 Tax=Epithele typhae TaxID=378194 RepID=UPI0020084529|nr:uncharacterized protein BXZ73DRAFT_106316 [Epithele typhae]KAH9915187.1 hypothetical protein BXZ73DRAFT_106316 [Epithele typhae]
MSALPNAYGTSKGSAHVTLLARHRGSGVARASRSPPPHGQARMHLGPPLMVLADGSHELRDTRFKITVVSAAPSIAVPRHTTAFEASRTYRLNKGAVDRFPLSNPAAKVGYGPAPGGGAHDPMNAAP